MKQTVAVHTQEEHSTSLLWCVVGLLVPRATLLGALSPFGIALAACGGAANLPTLLCVAVGYLIATPALLPLRYLAAVGLVAAEMERANKISSVCSRGLWLPKWSTFKC